MKIVIFIITALCVSGFAEGKPVKKEVVLAQDTFSGSLFSQNAQTIKLDAKAWQQWKVLNSLEHGSTVKKGDTILQFNKESFSKESKNIAEKFSLTKLTYQKNLLAANSQTLRLEQAKELNALKHKAAIASKDLYAVRGKKISQEERAGKVKAAKFKLR